ncbi:MAG: hypothetical protein K8I30_07380 [Anaerolineae bacterium]|nr:hypothetical protein [Anaerolineae bacterium]
MLLQDTDKIVPISTVSVEPVENYPALKMTWEHTVIEADVAPAFRKIMNALDATNRPIYIIVDLLRNPRFPMMVTVQEALPCYRDPMLKEWLIVGSNWMAKAIEGTLARITRHKNVRWFNTAADAMAYLQSVLAA